MDPVTAGIIGAVGAGVSAIGTISGGMAAADRAKYQAQIARNNETIAQQRANYARQAGAVATEAAGRQARARQGALTAALAAGGIDVNTGSAEDLRESTAMTGALNQLTVDHNAMLNQYGYRSQATGYQADAALADAAASQAVPSALLGAAGSLMGGVSKLPLKYQWMAEPSGSWSPRS